MSAYKKRDAEKDAGDDRYAASQPIHVVQKINRVGDADEPENGNEIVDDFRTGQRQSHSEIDDRGRSDHLRYEFGIRFELIDVIKQARKKQQGCGKQNRIGIRQGWSEEKIAGNKR